MMEGVSGVDDVVSGVVVKSVVVVDSGVGGISGIVFASWIEVDSTVVVDTFTFDSEATSKTFSSSVDGDSFTH
jgi:hypothetical protein